MHKIAIVDDDRQSVERIKELIEAVDSDAIFYTADSVESIKKFGEFDLVILDKLLSGGLGTDHKHKFKCPVIVFSGIASEINGEINKADVHKFIDRVVDELRN